VAYIGAGSAAADVRQVACDLPMLHRFFCSNGDWNVPSGTVKFFISERGFGFIVPDDGGNDVFVHITAVHKAGYNGLVEGARISYELGPTRTGKLAAENLRLG
jgi:cold shock protein